MRLRAIYILALLLFSTTTSYGQAQTTLTPDSLIVITPQNINKLALHASFPLPNALDIAWRSDGRQLLLGTDDGAWVLDLPDGKPEHIDYGNIDKVTYLTQTSQIALDDLSQLVIHIDDLPRRSRVLDRPFSGVIGFSHSGERIAVGGNDTVTINDLRTYAQYQSFAVKQDQACSYACSISDVAFSPDDSHLVFAADVPEVEAAIVNLRTGERVSPIDIGGRFLQFNYNGSLIASAAGTPGYIADRAVLTDAASGKALMETKLYVSSLAFSSDGHLLAVGIYDVNAPNPDEARGFVDFFDVQQLLPSGGEAQSIMLLPSTRPPSAIKFSSDDRLVAISDGAGQLGLWGVASAGG